jgi:putative two-component system response regulator
MTARHVHQELPPLNHRAFRCHEQRGRPESAAGIRRGSPHTVLVIADEADVLRSIQDVLHLRYQISAAIQPERMRETVVQRPVPIVLGDPRMPAMIGIEFVSRIGVDPSKTIRLFLTGHADIQAVIDAINAGRVYRYVSESWDPDDLQAILRRARGHPCLLSHRGPHTLKIRARKKEFETAAAEMVQAYDTTLEGWSRALELGDQETDGHSRGISELAVRLAEAMGMDKAQLLHVRRGALLHDIGKVGIPSGILIKPGPLTEEEWGIMKRHASYGYELLAPLAFLREALDIPYCHHERWDGSGYPRGLKGEQIPLAARIFAVIDVWDALASDRPYRKAWRERDAREYIHSLSGAHFDPQVVETFLRVVV